MDMHEDRHCRSRLVAGQINISIYTPHSHRNDPSFSQHLPETASSQHKSVLRQYTGSKRRSDEPSELRSELTDQEISTVNVCATAAFLFLLKIDSLPGCFRRPQRGREQTHLPRPAAVKVRQRRRSSGGEMNAWYWSFPWSKITSKSLVGRKDFLATADLVTSENIPSQVGSTGDWNSAIRPTDGNAAECIPYQSMYCSTSL